MAERYRGDGRAGELVVDLLKLEVPKLFAMEGGGEEDETVGREFSAFLRDYISRNALKLTILGKMNIILVRHSEKFSVQRASFLFPLLPSLSSLLLPSLLLSSFLPSSLLLSSLLFPLLLLFHPSLLRLQYQTSEMSSSSWFWQ